MKEVRPNPKSVPTECPNCGGTAPTVLDEHGLPICSLCSWREGAW